MLLSPSKKMSDTLQQAVFNDYDYRLLSSDEEISIEAMKAFNKNDPGNKELYSDKAYKIITFSRKMMEYQRFIRNRQIERARKLLKELDPETYKKGPPDVTRFIKRRSSTKSGESVTDLYEIDQSVIEEEEKYDGYYAVATNLDDPVKEIIRINS